MPIVDRLSLGTEIGIRDRGETSLMTRGRRIKQLKFCGDRVEQGCGNDAGPIFAGKAFPNRVGISSRIVRDGLGGGIVNLIESRKSEISTDHRICGQAVVTARVAMVHDLVIVEIEEHFVLQNRAANSAAEIAVTQERNWSKVSFGVTEPERVRGKGIVLNVVVSCSVKSVGPALGDLIEDDPANAILSREGGSIDLQFAHILKHCRIRILAVRKGGRSSVGNDVAVRQIAIDGDFLAWVRRALR